MKTLRLPIALLLLAGAAASAQVPVQPAPPVSDLIPLTPPPGARRTAAELEQLLAPIALYPDALIALILPASTASTDIVLAARHVRDSGNDRSQIEHRAWDESVKSLTHYPDILKWMDENLQWTKQVGEAFAEQPVEVMQAIQRLRARARTAGTLVDTPQQQVLTDLEVIRIVPAQSSAIYVPYYEPAYVFVNRPINYVQPFVTFGIGLPVGSWLAFECDWRRHTIWVGNRHRRWTGHDWRRPVVPVPILAPTYAHHHPEVRPWRPPVQPGRPPFAVARTVPHEVVRPIPNSFVRPPQVGSPVAGVIARPTPPVRPPNAPGPQRRGPPQPVPADPGPPLPPATVVPPLASFTPNAATTPPANTPAAPANAAVTQRRGRPDRQPTNDNSAQTSQRPASDTPRPQRSAPPVVNNAQPPPAPHPRPERTVSPSFTRGAPPTPATPSSSAPSFRATTPPVSTPPAAAPQSSHPRQERTASPSYSRSAQPQHAAPPPAAPSTRATPPPAPTPPAATPPAAAPSTQPAAAPATSRREDSKNERLR